MILVSLSRLLLLLLSQTTAPSSIYPPLFASPGTDKLSEVPPTPTHAVSDRADRDVAEHGQRPLFSGVGTEATSGRFDARLYDLPSTLALSTREEEEEEEDAAVTAKKGLRGT